MPYPIPPSNSLVLYKNSPAYVRHVGDKVEIELVGGKTMQVRPKDVQLLHPGPIRSLEDLALPEEGEVEVAWELLAGETTNLAELAELIYGDYTPATVWATWQEVTDGLYFKGTVEEVVVSTEAEVAQERARREAKIAEEAAWTAFLERVQANQIAPEDSRYLEEVAQLALNQQSKSRVLHALGQTETPENAHALLLKLGYWDHTRNPYPERLGLPTSAPTSALPQLPQEERVDLTHLPTFAIDDVDTQDPDDALSLEGNRLWVHVADVAVLVPPGTPADQEASARGANLYLPEGTVPMLPSAATQILGLGLAEISPALSFGLDLNTAGEVVGVEIVPSWIRVRRLTYEEVETRLTEAPFQGLYQLAQTSLARRQANGAIAIDLPEVSVRVKEGQVYVRPLLPLKSRDLVREAMLMCGEALAHFAQQAGIPFAFTTQAPPEAYETLPGLAGMFALRRAMKPSQRQSEPDSHAGLGLLLYTQATSPLRRYADLVVHQQLRAHLNGETLLNVQEVLAQIGAAEAVSSSVRQVERLSRQHWTLVYLQAHPDWQGDGVLVERRGRRGLLLIPELDLEVWLHVPNNLALNSTVALTLRDVNLPMLEAYFQIGH